MAPGCDGDEVDDDDFSLREKTGFLSIGDSIDANSETDKTYHCKYGSAAHSLHSATGNDHHH